MVNVPFPPFSAPDKFSESGGRLVNAYPERLPDGRTVRRRLPGLSQLLGELGGLTCRGLIVVNDVLVAAVGERLFRIERIGGAYVATDLGALPGSEPVFFARNNKVPSPDLVAVTDTTAYVVSLTGGASGYPDPDVGSPNAVVFQGGYFLFSYGDGRMRASGLNSTSINTLDTAFAETRPDGLRRIINYGGDILAFGETSVEVWRNTGNPTGFPFSYVDTIERGLLTQTALAGNEPGFAAGVMWLGDDGVIYQMQGYKAARVSTHTIERQIAAVADKTAFEALVYVHNGHSCWALSCNEWTWEYDFSTGAWYERKSYGRNRWRARRSAWWRDRWIVGDDLTGFLFTVDPNAKQEAGQPLTAIVTSATMSPFPRGARWNTLDLDLMAGVGVAAGVSPVETAPVAMVAWSRDGGVTFGNPVHRPMGAQGEYTKRIRVNNLGLVSSQGAQVSVSVSDPVDFSLYSGKAAFAPLVT